MFVAKQVRNGHLDVLDHPISLCQRSHELAVDSKKIEVAHARPEIKKWMGVQVSGKYFSWAMPLRSLRSSLIS